MFITPIKPMEMAMNTDGKSNVEGMSIPFQNILSQAINETNTLSEISKLDNHALMMGDVDNLAQVQINSLKAKAMLETTVQLTTRVVNSYKEIMQMQI